MRIPDRRADDKRHGTGERGKNVWKGGVPYVALVKDENGEVVKKLEGDVPVALSPGQELLFKQSRCTDMEYFALPPGRYTLGVALLDKESGRTTARHSTLVVPPLGSGLAMSSVALIRKWQAKEPGAAADDPFVVGEQTVTPTLASNVNKSVSSSLPFYFVAYPDSHNPAPLTLTIEFNRDGKMKRIASADLPEPDAQAAFSTWRMPPLSSSIPATMPCVPSSSRAAK